MRPSVMTQPPLALWHGTLRVLLTAGLASIPIVLTAQAPPRSQAPPSSVVPPAAAGTAAPKPAGPAPPPADYVIGSDDILSVKVWQDERMSGDVVVRPDGMVTIALINDIKAAGLTPAQFRESLQKAALEFVKVPTVDVVVKQINSRKIFLTGEVNKPAAYPLSSRMTITQAIAMAGGLTEYANKGRVTILRTDAGKTIVLRVNYGDLMNGKNLHQNYELKVGDVVTVAD